MLRVRCNRPCYHLLDRPVHAVLLVRDLDAAHSPLDPRLKRQPSFENAHPTTKTARATNNKEEERRGEEKRVSEKDEQRA